MHFGHTLLDVFHYAFWWGTLVQSSSKALLLDTVAWPSCGHSWVTRWWTTLLSAPFYWTRLSSTLWETLVWHSGGTLRHSRRVFLQGTLWSPWLSDNLLAHSCQVTLITPLWDTMWRFGEPLLWQPAGPSNCMYLPYKVTRLKTKLSSHDFRESQLRHNLNILQPINSRSPTFDEFKQHWNTIPPYCLVNMYPYHRFFKE